MFQKAQKQNLNSNWSIRKALSLKWTSKYFAKKYIELARNHFHISTKIVIFLGNYQGNSLEQTLTNMETHTVASKKKKKEIIDCIFVLWRKFPKSQFQSLMEKVKQICLQLIKMIALYHCKVMQSPSTIEWKVPEFIWRKYSFDIIKCLCEKYNFTYDKDTDIICIQCDTNRMHWSISKNQAVQKWYQFTLQWRR